MARGPNFTQQFMNMMSQSAAQNSDSYARILETLSQMNNTLGEMNTNIQQFMRPGGPDGRGAFGSQSQARDTRDGSRNNNQGPFAQHHANWTGRNSSHVSKTFLDGFEKALLDSLGGSQFKDGIKKSLNKFAEALGTDIDGLQEEFGSQIGKILSNNIKNSNLGKRLNLGDDLFDSLKQKIFEGNNMSSLTDMLKEMKTGNHDMTFLYDKFASSIGNASPVLGKLAGGAGKALGAIDKFTGGLGGTAIAIALAKKVMNEFVAGGKRALEGFSDFGKVLKAASNRYTASQEQNLKYANERLKADIETLITEPFTILKKSAEEVYSAWNSNLRLVAGTQGYTKADVQDLMSEYAQRIQQEGLDRTVASTEVYNNLAKVIQSGLTGRAAVEFAYQATKYNAALPNQDFFNYVDTYASVAANAIAAGKSEAEALQIANNSLADFSNSLLYASRNLVGGYSTGLKAADSIYSSAVKIAQAARSDNINQIASSLLAIQGYVGSIAPDLASSLSDKIYQIATGGNASDIVALRSLAGINASNTEFLRALANNPQSVLGNMFANLGNMFTQSADAYMEKAESYASLFGISSEAFQRIDFMSLAAAVNNMDSNTNTLEENMKLLRDGQTTTNADQLKIAQINKYMVEEGLAYVIDNEAAQMIQEHMWDEQMKRELMEAEYGVNLVGGAAEALQKIVSGIDRILSILNPAAWFAKVVNVIETSTESANQQADLRQLLELGRVGNKNTSAISDLLTRNRNLKLTSSLVELMGGTANYKSGLSGFSTFLNNLGNPLQSAVTTAGNIFNAVTKGNNLLTGRHRDAGAAVTSVGSQYQWGNLGNISKSAASLASALLTASDASAGVSHNIVTTANEVVSASAATAKDKLEKMLSEDYLVQQYINQGKSYQEWLNSGKQFGITDTEQALKDAGYDLLSVQDYFQNKQTEAGLTEIASKAEEEKQFRQVGLQFMSTRFWDEYKTPMLTQVTALVGGLDSLVVMHTGWRDTQLQKLQNIVDNQVDWKQYFDSMWSSSIFSNGGEGGLLSKFFDEFVKIFVDHTYYNNSGYKYSDVTAIQRQENAEKGAAVYALADALTENFVDLKNPSVQTNALLAQILVVATAIMNQNNNVAGTVSLSDALTGLALGLTNTTPMDQIPT